MLIKRSRNENACVSSRQAMARMAREAVSQASEALRSEVGVRAGAVRTSVRNAVDNTMDRVAPSPERVAQSRGAGGGGVGDEDWAASVENVSKEQAALHEQLERAERQLLYLEQRAELIEV